MDHSCCSGLKAVPLHQQIKGRNDERHASTKVIRPPVMLVFPVTSRRQLIADVGWLRQVWNFVDFSMDEIEYMFYNLIKENYGPSGR